MIYLAAYVAAGVLLMLAAWLYGRLSPRFRATRVVNYLLGYNEQVQWRELVRKFWFVCLCIGIWPLVLVVLPRVFEGDDDFDPGTGRQEPEEPNIFLVEQFDRETVAARETIHDPHGGAPAVPFGHLNRLWAEFCESIGPDDQIWSYRLAGDSDSTQPEAEGYCLLRYSSIAATITSHCAYTYQLPKTGDDYAYVHTDQE